MVETDSQMDAPAAHRALDRASGAFGRLAESIFGAQREQERHNALLLELSDAIDELLTPPADDAVPRLRDKLTVAGMMVLPGGLALHELLDRCANLSTLAG